MSQFIYHIHYRTGYNIGKQDRLSRCSVEEKCRKDANFCNLGQLLELENDNVAEEEDMKDVELEGIDVAAWEKKNIFCVVSQ